MSEASPSGGLGRGKVFPFPRLLLGPLRSPMYSAAFWCLFVVLLFYFWLYCVTTVTPFTERSEGWTLRFFGVLDQSQQECGFFRRNSNPLQIFQLWPKRETSSSSLGDRLEKRSIISSSNRAIFAGLRDTLLTFRTVARAEMARQLGSCTVKKRVFAHVV